MTIFLKNLDLSQLKTKARRKTTTKGKIHNIPISFPVKLYQMLQEVEREGNQDIVGWNADGKTFRVRPQKMGRFVDELLPRWFKQSKYKSFQRQLNFYQFQRILSGPLEGSYGHSSFIKGHPELCRNIQRHPSQQQQKQPATEHQQNNKTEHQQNNKIPFSPIAHSQVEALGTELSASTAGPSMEEGKEMFAV